MLTAWSYLRKVGPVVGSECAGCAVCVGLYVCETVEAPRELMSTRAIQVLLERRVYDRLSRRWNASGAGACAGRSRRDVYRR